MKSLHLIRLLFCASILLFSPAVFAMSSDDGPSRNEEPRPVPLGTTHGTGFTVQKMSGNRGASYVWGIQTFADHHLFIFQFKSRSDRPDKAYQVSLKHETWLEAALLYGYRYESGSFRGHAAAGPGFVGYKELGAFIYSYETTVTRLGTNQWGRKFYYHEDHRSDYYDVVDEKSAAIVFDAGIGFQLGKYFHIGAGVHGAVARTAHDIGFFLNLGFGSF